VVLRGMHYRYRKTQWQRINGRTQRVRPQLQNARPRPLVLLADLAGSSSPAHRCEASPLDSPHPGKRAVGGWCKEVIHLVRRAHVGMTAARPKDRTGLGGTSSKAQASDDERVIQGGCVGISPRYRPSFAAATPAS